MKKQVMPVLTGQEQTPEGFPVSYPAAHCLFSSVKSKNWKLATELESLLGNSVSLFTCTASTKRGITASFKHQLSCPPFENNTRDDVFISPLTWKQHKISTSGGFSAISCPVLTQITAKPSAGSATWQHTQNTNPGCTHPGLGKKRTSAWERQLCKVLKSKSKSQCSIQSNCSQIAVDSAFLQGCKREGDQAF